MHLHPSPTTASSQQPAPSSLDASGKEQPRDGVIILVDLKEKGDREQLQIGIPQVLGCAWMRTIPIFVLYNEDPKYTDYMRKIVAASPQVRFVSLEGLGAWVHPSEYNQTSTFKVPKFSLGYRMMCDLWATRIHEVARKLSLEYYIRLDADSHLTCSNGSLDVFQEMRSGRKSYGYYATLRDPKRVADGYLDLVKKYVLDHGLNLSGTIAGELPLANQNTNQGTIGFQTNFEVVRVSYLFDPRVLDFTAAVSQSRGIYENRWGDALIRFSQVALFLRSEDTICFDQRNHMTYLHQGSHRFPARCQERIR